MIMGSVSQMIDKQKLHYPKYKYNKIMELTKQHADI